MPAKQTYAIKIDAEVLTRIRALNQKWGIGIAEFIRRAIARGLKEWEESRTPPW